MLLRFTYILNDAVALAPNPTARRRRLESGEEDCNDGATTSRAVRTMALRRGAGTETSVARRRARSKEVGCKGKEARYDEKQGDGDVSGKEEGSGGRHEVVERGGAQPFGWLICFFLVFVAVGAVKDSVCMILLSV